MQFYQHLVLNEGRLKHINPGWHPIHLYSRGVQKSLSDYTRPIEWWIMVVSSCDIGSVIHDRFLFIDFTFVCDE